MMKSWQLLKTALEDGSLQVTIRVFAIVFCLAWLFFVYRTWIAYRLRIGIMRNDLDTYGRLPSLGKMVFRFWRPLSSFVNEAREDAPNRGSPDKRVKQ